ncbi:hypothetical protein CEXT_640141 [Caerostris extrusa]|uniref:Uncharacterized protein n=1 Tax=Caerostris extrusa TaxID=172846 RepID=A0AAV4NZ00_CAEEX|nr:hypothetical protein CEXT_640141 [Caerostris extrusa]
MTFPTLFQPICAPFEWCVMPTCHRCHRCVIPTCHICVMSTLLARGVYWVAYTPLIGKHTFHYLPGELRDGRMLSPLASVYKRDEAPPGRADLFHNWGMLPWFFSVYNYLVTASSHSDLTF